MPRTTNRSFDSFNITYLPAAKPSLLNRILGAILSLGMLALALTFSLAFFVVLACAGVVFAGWLWWKTRHMRKLMRAAAEQAQAYRAQEAAGNYDAGAERPASTQTDARIIDGEVLYRDNDKPGPHNGRLS